MLKSSGGCSDRCSGGCSDGCFDGCSDGCVPFYKPYLLVQEPDDDSVHSPPQTLRNDLHRIEAHVGEGRNSFVPKKKFSVLDPKMGP